MITSSPILAAITLPALPALWPAGRTSKNGVSAGKAIDATARHRHSKHQALATRWRIVRVMRAFQALGASRWRDEVAPFLAFSRPLSSTRR
jgi:hypothetical protein